jgi:predicted SAM-dependent methyltransferase
MRLALNNERDRMNSRTFVDSLNLGCGKDYRYGKINVDFAENIQADIKHDLNKHPYPFKDGSMHTIIAFHILEHLENPIKTLQEIHRLLWWNGVCIIKVPHCQSNSAWCDITHKRAYGYQTFSQLENPQYCKQYNIPIFHQVKVRFNYHKRWYYPWNYLIEPLGNIKPVLFEHLFGNIFPPFEIEARLTK